MIAFLSALERETSVEEGRAFAQQAGGEEEACWDGGADEDFDGAETRNWS
jgi:hypothetical protein